MSGLGCRWANGPPSLSHCFRAFTLPEGECSWWEFGGISSDIPHGICKVAGVADEGVSVVSLPDASLSNIQSRNTLPGFY